ncbi:MAG: helix-turn-helix domain-containing protein [Beijerinckiaceae bacterium]|jgi:excisionase family DNA binding protein|nr:helix-turn-helix domain-containing protein [Beijerinckiaceae bacterium]
MNSHDELLSLKETMLTLKRSRAGLYNMLKRGEITAVKHGKATCFKRSEVNRYLANLPVFRSRAQGGRSDVAA